MELATQLQTQIEAFLTQGSSIMPHHQIRTLEGVKAASDMEHMQHEATTSEYHFKAT